MTGSPVSISCGEDGTELFAAGPARYNRCMAAEITISVRNLVEFLLRSGDIDNRIGAGGEDAMLEGSRMHRRLQKAAGADYQAEVPLKTAYTYGKRIEGAAKQFFDDATVILEGRADGIYYGAIPGKAGRKGDNDPCWTIDEIKTTYRRIRNLKKPEPVHLAQAKCYAYIYMMQHDLDIVRVRMTYCSLITEDVRYFYETDQRGSLIRWFASLMEEYRRWAEYSFTWQLQRDGTIRSLAFPFPYREGQKELAAGVYHTISQGRKLFLEAPTGTGKTITTLFPAIQAMGQQKTEKIFYLTAKTITRTAAEDTVRLLRQKGLRIKSVILSAREKACILPKPDCNPDACPRAKGHYDRINRALFDLLVSADSFDRETIADYADRYQVCPFEMCLDLSLFADVIIGDYNYVFDPHAYLRRFFGEGNAKGSYVFLIDEAHNLVDRGRDMYSAELFKSDVLSLRRRIKGIYPALERKLTKCNQALLAIRKQTKGCTVLEDIGALADAVYSVEAAIGDISRRERAAQVTGAMKRDPLRLQKKEVHDELMDFYFGISHFLLIYEKLDSHYVVYSELQEDGNLMVRLFNVDPSLNLKECMDRGRASILFSATFLPIQYYKSLLGGTGEDYENYARSVFDPGKRGLFLVRDVTSKYKERTPAQFGRIARCIYEITGKRHGNYLIFFPSYSFMEEVAERFESRFAGGLPASGAGDAESTLPAVPDDLRGLVPASDITVVRQNSHMSEQDRETFLAQFADARQDRSLLGFCVLGGIFSEGIDLRRDSLIGVIIVGTGMPQVCSERELLKRYFDSQNLNGFDYAYRFPGMNKVLQAAGRVIRTAEDVGVVALLDERFVTPTYRRLFPEEWNNYIATTSGEVATLVEKFWDSWL